jgi:hypothetical protein
MEKINKIGYIKNSGEICLVMYKTNYIKEKDNNFYKVLYRNIVLTLFEKNVILPMPE